VSRQTVRLRMIRDPGESRDCCFLKSRSLYAENTIVLVTVSPPFSRHHPVYTGVIAMPPV
jgi:hypothetical protein